MMDYLDASAGVTDSQWLDIFTESDGEQADFWTVAQVVPGEVRAEGDRLARRWLAGDAPETSLDCWFRRVVCRLGRRTMAPVAPWCILMAMAHAWAGRAAPSPSDYARKVNMPIEAETYARAVSIARDECPESPTHETWFLPCNR